MSRFTNGEKRGELDINGMGANELLERELEFERMVENLEDFADQEDGEDNGY